MRRDKFVNDIAPEFESTATRGPATERLTSNFVSSQNRPLQLESQNEAKAPYEPDARKLCVCWLHFLLTLREILV